MVLLKDIAELQSGVYLKPSESVNSKKFHLVGLKDFDDELSFLDTAVEVDSDQVREKYIVGDGDVLFSSRIKFNAFLLPCKSAKTFVASNSFIIIRPNTEKVLPGYLDWFFNNKTTQDRLALLAQATGRVPYVSLKDLEEFEIELPSLSVQMDIVRLYKLHKKERHLIHQLLNKKEIHLQSILLKASKL